MTLVGKLRRCLLAPKVAERSQFYACQWTTAERLEHQLRLWNQRWREITNAVPYYQQLQKQLNLPEQFSSWEEFRAKMPITTRQTIQQHAAQMCSTRRRADFQRQTGGSTAQPIQVPAWRSEVRYTTPDIWLGRSWYGVFPDSRLFLLWGHSHLLGTGYRAVVRRTIRELKDWLVGIYRFSAYDLRPTAMRAAIGAMIRFRPDFLMGYSVALDLLARTCEQLKLDLRHLGLKLVLGAAESFPASDSQQRLSELFGCPAGMEYGSVETGLMAHTCPEGGYRVFWRTYFLEAEEAAAGIGRPVLVTSLFPRCVPLVRYRIGDEITLGDSDEPSYGLASFRRVLGRCNDYVLMSDGAVLHSESFTHAVRWCEEVLGYQVVQNGTEIQLRIMPRDKLSTEARREIHARLARIHPHLANVPLVEVERLQQTVAGKTSMVVRV